MPIHAVKGGYKWGEHGHTYKSKAGAKKQEAAIFANGYRGDKRVTPEDFAQLNETDPLLPTTKKEKP